MNIKSFLVVAISAGIFGISCSGNDQEAVDKSLKQEAVTTTTNSAVINDSATLQNVNSANTQNVNLPVNPVQPVIQPSVQPGSQVLTQQIKPQPVATTAATKTAAGMNPPHGQPGHRCDIEVGAPLNSAPKTSEPVKVQQNATTVPVPKNATTITPTLTQTPATTSPTGTATGKLNPAHGQPGHKCEIAVGAPLN